MKRTAVLTVLGVLTGGCSLPAANWYGSSTERIITILGDKFDQQGTIDRFVANIRGHVQNPGMESYINTRVSVGLRVVGADGDVAMNTTGSGPMDPEMIPDWARTVAQDYIDNGDLEGLATFLELIKNFGNTTGSEETLSDETTTVPIPGQP